MNPARFEFVSRLLLYVAMAWVMLWIHTGLSIWPFDDAFIHIRIAENLIDHGEPYFNPGEAVMASSSPVWTWCLALLYLVLPLDPALIAVVNAGIECRSKTGTLLFRDSLKDFFTPLGAHAGHSLLRPENRL